MIVVDGPFGIAGSRIIGIGQYPHKAWAAAARYVERTAKGRNESGGGSEKGC